MVLAWASVLRFFGYTRGAFQSKRKSADDYQNFPGTCNFWRYIPQEGATGTPSSCLSLLYGCYLGRCMPLTLSCAHDAYLTLACPSPGPHSTAVQGDDGEKRRRVASLSDDRPPAGRQRGQLHSADARPTHMRFLCGAVRCGKTR